MSYYTMIVERDGTDQQCESRSLNVLASRERSLGVDAMSSYLGSIRTFCCDMYIVFMMFYIKFYVRLFTLDFCLVRV